MRKSTKICLITALVFFVISIGCMITGSVIGENPFQIAKKIWNGGLDWSIASEQYDEQFDKDYDLSKFTLLKECDASGIDDLQVRAGRGTVVVKAVSGESCRVWINEEKHSDAVTVSEESGTLNIVDKEYGKLFGKKSLFKNVWTQIKDHDMQNIVVEIPDKLWKTIDTEVQCGAVKIYDLKSEKLNVNVEAGNAYGCGLQVCTEAALNVDMGNVVWEDIQSRKVTLNVEMGNLQVKTALADMLQAVCDMGRMEFESVHAQSMTADCSMGNMDIGLTGRKEDYFISYDSSMGSVDIEGGHAKRNSQADNEIDLTCDMGNINVSFLGKELSR